MRPSSGDGRSSSDLNLNLELPLSHPPPGGDDGFPKMQIYALTIPPSLRWWLTRFKTSIIGLRRRTMLGIALGVLTLLLLVGGRRVPNGGMWREADVDASYGPRNRTLGFEKIFYLSMKHRTDRQDMMALISGYLDLEFTMVESVNGSSISDKAKPYDVRNPPKKPVRPAELGCWRSHAQVWAHIASSGITSALILEDDADFTSSIQEVMSDIDTHLRRLTGAPRGEPYGINNSDSSWDVLTLGHCYGEGEEGPPAAKFPKAAKIWEAWEDQYAPAMDQYRIYLPLSSSNRIRVLLPTYAPICTTGYAVTKMGAMRLLYNVGGPGGALEMPVDMLMAEKFKAGLLKGYTTVPSLMAQWKWGTWRDTDVQGEPEEGSTKGTSEDIVGSVREEIAKRFGPGEGARNVWKEFEGASYE